MPKGFANLDVPAIKPERVGYCHPAQAKRTKCVCGAACRLWHRSTRCECGRRHIKASGPAFGATGAQPVRPGGRAGCPGVDPDVLSGY